MTEDSAPIAIRQPMISDIQTATAKFYKLARIEMMSERRSAAAKLGLARKEGRA